MCLTVLTLIDSLRNSGHIVFYVFTVLLCLDATLACLFVI